MLLIPCPHCGPRPEIEFRCGGEAHIARPAAPADVGDADWASYLFYRTNPKDVYAERWLHAHGCQRWFNALRDTASDRVIATYAMGEPRPAVPTPIAPARVPSPLVGEGQGGGDGRTSAVGIPPTPSPSPQGGGEEC
jgi:sarcosine oxidase subunit delta